MIRSEFTCSNCGSSNLRRSRAISLPDLPKMIVGIYPFRCLDCRERSWINVWMFAHGKDPRCPRCLSGQIISSSPHRMRLKLWQSLLVRLGASGHRCKLCDHRFLSFRRNVTTPGPETNKPAELRGKAMAASRGGK